MTVRRDELDAIVLEQDLEQRAHAAALTFARVALRASSHYKVLAGGGGANEWVRREAEPLADAIAAAMLTSLRNGVAGVRA